jgi:hypothetical protein
MATMAAVRSRAYVTSMDTSGNEAMPKTPKQDAFAQVMKVVALCLPPVLMSLGGLFALSRKRAQVRGAPGGTTPGGHAKRAGAARPSRG